MKSYQIELEVVATAYLRANSKEEAIELLRSSIDPFQGVEVSELAEKGINISPVATVLDVVDGDWDLMEEA